MATKRYRMRYDFQLNVAKDDELAIAEQITALKGQGRYSKTVRDGIRLVSDLNAGSLDVLFELFPWVRADFLEYMTSVQSAKSEAETSIQQQLARIEELLATGDSLTSTASMNHAGVGPKALSVPHIAAPAWDDEDDDLQMVKQQAAHGNAAKNFLDNAFKLVQ